MRWFANRKYKSGVGTKFAFLCWSDAQQPYLTRLFLIKTPWFAVCINKIKQPDDGDPHDHTSAFLSIILRGWYYERRIITRNGVTKDKGVLRCGWNYMRGCDWDTHRILDVSKGGCVTLCLMGPKVRDWYHHTEDGMVPWAKYRGIDNG